MALNINLSQCSAQSAIIPAQTIGAAPQGLVLNGSTGPANFQGPSIQLNSGEVINTWEPSPVNANQVIVKSV